MLVLLAAWFGGERLILRPIRSLVRTATRFGRGDLRARAADDPWMAEFEPLAAAFDDMARKLAAREEELRIANQHLEELASLDGLTGLANRRGFDRELDRAWRQAEELEEPLALMMIDIDHFKLFNASAPEPAYFIGFRRWRCARVDAVSALTRHPPPLRQSVISGTTTRLSL